MSAPDSLLSLYTDEMKDLWSANDQMKRAVKTLADEAHDPKLKEMLETSLAGIDKHTASLKDLIAESDDEVEPEHCKGMEGLVKEALKHGVEEAPEDGELHDIAIITQYQRMSHYGITGFGSVATLAEALGKKEDVAALKKIVSDIYKSDEYSSHLGEKAAKHAAKHA
jgi:ferritin-like metal-binding protein YciE